MPVEVELKFLAETAEPLEALAREERLGPAALRPAETVDELDRYLDTPDGRLAARHWACRLRSRQGERLVSLKGPPEDGATAGGALHRRPEVEAPAGDGLDPSAWPASEARSLLLDLGAGRPLEERLRLRQRRTERAVLVDGRDAGTLSLDRVTVEGGGRELGRFFVVELELHEEAQLAPLEAALTRRRGLRPDPTTKLERALQMTGDAGRRPAT